MLEKARGRTVNQGLATLREHELWFEDAGPFMIKQLFEWLFVIDAVSYELFLEQFPDDLLETFEPFIR